MRLLEVQLTEQRGIAGARRNMSDEMTRYKIIVLVMVAVLAIAAISYFLFGIPLWLALAGATAAILINGLVVLARVPISGEKKNKDTE